MQEGVTMEEMLRKIAEADAEAVDTLLTAAGVNFRQLKPTLQSITLDFVPEEDK